MNALLQALDYPLALRVSLALVHFLWQGLALAGVALTLLLLLRRASAQVRYLALLGVLGAMAVCPVVTFAKLSGAATPMVTRVTPPSAQERVRPATREAIPLPTPALRVPAPAPDFAAPRTALPARVWHRVQPRLAWISVLWMLGVVLLSLRFFLRGWSVSRLGRRLPTAEARWQELLVSVAGRLRLRRPVRLVTSLAACSPMVIGWLRPVIVLPVSALTGLTPEQIRALLAHELAHLRRHDQWVNLAQSVIELLLFYHPAVWWVSRAIRVERELCCDDLVISVCGEAGGYMKALAWVEEHRRATPAAALAASGSPLLRRMRRLAGPPVVEDARPRWLAAALVLVMVGTVLAAGAISRATAQGPGYETRPQWQPQTMAPDPRLDQPVQIEILGRAAMSGLELLSKQTGVSLQVAPEDLKTVGERKFTVLARGCSLRTIMVQLPKALRECHWDVVEGAKGPSYLLHRNGNIVYYGSHELHEALYWHELRPAREARIAEARQALAMSNDELTQLEKTDLTLARGVQNPDTRALLRLFLSLPDDAMEQFLETGLVSMKVQDAPASWKPVLEHELTREYDDAAAKSNDSAKSWLKDTQARLSQGTVGFEHGGSDDVYIRIAGNNCSRVLWTKYPFQRPGRGDWFERSSLLQPGEDPKAGDALFEDWGKRGVKARTEQHDQSLLATKPGLADWKDSITLWQDGRHEFLEIEQAVSAKTGLSVISDYFTTPPLDLPAETRQPMLAWRALDLVTRYQQYQWEKVGNCLVLHRSDWYDLAACEIPESLILAYREKLKRQGQFTLEDAAAFTVAFFKSRASLLQEIPRTPSNPGNMPPDLMQAGLWPSGLWSHTLSLYASLSPEQREKMQSPSGLPFSEMTQTQQSLVRQESGRWDNPPPPPENEVAEAILRLKERPADAGARSYELVLAFPHQDFTTQVTLQPIPGKSMNK